jgi:hypothetical protein
VRAGAAGALLLALAGCAAPRPVAPPVAEVQAAPPPVAAPAEPEDPAPPDPLGRGRALVSAWKEAPWDDAEKRSALARTLGASEAELRALLRHLARGCLAETDGASPGCKEIGLGGASPAAEVLPTVIELLGEVADPAPRVSPAVRLLRRLDKRGVWMASRALDRVLGRRDAPACAPPGAAEIAAARQALGDFAIAEGPAPRWPTKEELDDLAYLSASFAGAGPPVGSFVEEYTSPPLPEGHPDRAAREAFDVEMQAALLDGDAERHLRAAEAYLRTLGYPERIRIPEETSAHWGGAHASYVLRDAAMSAEILGRDELAEGLYRRANPGGGMCGTSIEATRAEQMRAVVRTASRARGCRAAAPELLYALDDRDRVYGPPRLAAAGFDVPRLYRAALLTLGRDDPAALKAAFAALPARAAEAVARVDRHGPEAWATRVRAIPGYADTARGASLDRLLAIAEHGLAPEREEAITAFSHLAYDHGWDPCVPTRLGQVYGTVGSSDRAVGGLMDRCETRLPRAVVEAAVRRLSPLAKDPDPRVRQAVAEAFGRLGSPLGRPALKLLAADTFDAGGQICSSKNGGPTVCGKNLPVARAAREAEEQLAEADKMRAEQRARR